MSTTHQWLQRLGQATDYRELQSIFSELANEANGTSDDKQLVTSIDQAIRRIEQERARDAEELQDFESQYAEFKDQQRGVLGWFRRHVPFTQTRRQEVQHKETIADQKAEILADNLVIARAQMLKQKLLPSEERQLGDSSQLWKSKLTDCESVERIRDYASTIEALSAEFSVSQAFVNDIRSEIDSFAKADFTSKDDRNRQKADLEQARAEFAEFETELEEERLMRTEAIKRAGELVTELLLQTDHDFYQLAERIEQLRNGKRLAKDAAGKADDFANVLGEIHRLSEACEACAEERDQLRTERERLHRDQESVQPRLERLERKLAKVTGPCDDARRTADRADAAFDAAQRIYDQHRQAASGDSGPVSQSNDAVKAEFDPVSQERADAYHQLESANAPYDLAKSKHDKCKQKHESIEQAVKKVEATLQENHEQENRLSAQLQDAMKEGPRALAEFEPLLDKFLHCIETLPIHSQVKRLSRTLQPSEAFGSRIVPHYGDRLDARSDESEHQIESLIRAIDQDRHELKRLASAAQDERHQWWSRRCHELLGDEVAELVTNQ